MKSQIMHIGKNYFTIYSKNWDFIEGIGLPPIKICLWMINLIGIKVLA